MTPATLARRGEPNVRLDGAGAVTMPVECQQRRIDTLPDRITIDETGRVGRRHFPPTDRILTEPDGRVPREHRFAYRTANAD